MTEQLAERLGGQTTNLALPPQTAPQRLSPSHVGSRLQRVRQDRGLRLVDVARGIVSVGYLSMIEQGQRRPSDSVIKALAKRLDVDVAVLESDSLGSPRLDDVLAWQDACWWFSQQQFDEAARAFEGIIRQQSSMVPNATRWLARTYFEQGRCDDALTLLMRPVAALCEPHDLWTAVYIDLLSGLCLLKLGDLDAAEESLQRAADAAREHLPGSNLHMYSLGYLGRCHVRRGHMQAALHVLTECYATMDLLAPGSNLESLALQCRGLAEAARASEDLVSAIRLNERANVYANMRRVATHGAMIALEIAAFHLRIGAAPDLARASQIAERVIMTMSGERTAGIRSRASLVLAEVALRNSDADAASAAVERAKAALPDWDRPWVHAVEALIWELRGDSPKALQAAEAAAAAIGETAEGLRRTDELTEPWEVLAGLFRRLGESERAWQCMRNAVKGAGVPIALVQLAMTH